VERPDVLHANSSHRRARAGVDRHRLSEDPGQSQVLEPVPEELTRSFARQAVAPVAAQDPVPELGLPIDWALVGALRRLQDPPADELAIDEPGPEAESRNPPRGRETSPVEPLDLLAGARSTVAQVAHHLRIRVEVDFLLEVLVRQRDEPDAARVKRRLTHGPVLAHPTRGAALARLTILHWHAPRADALADRAFVAL